MAPRRSPTRLSRSRTGAECYATPPLEEPDNSSIEVVAQEPEPEIRPKQKHQDDPRGKCTAWLSSLNRRDRKALYQVFLDKTNPKNESRLDTTIQEILLTLSNGINPTRSGLWYFKLTCCEVTRLGRNAKDPRHPHWQFSIAGMRRDGILQLLEGRLSDAALTGLKALPNHTRRHQPQARLYVHEIAYAAKFNGLKGRPSQIPDNKAGRGGGISHLCDQFGCMKQAHLEPAWRHIDNIRRRGCSGIILVVFQRTIVMEVPCPHAETGEGMEGQLRTSCQKVRICHLDEEGVKLVVGLREGIQGKRKADHDDENDNTRRKRETQPGLRSSANGFCVEIQQSDVLKEAVNVGEMGGADWQSERMTRRTGEQSATLESSSRGWYVEVPLRSDLM